MTRSWLYPEQQLRRRAQAWAVKLKVNPEQVQIKLLPGKWGSCAPNGVVTLADDLSAKDEDFQDYVIVHELLHLRYRDHGKQFKAMMTALVPNWRELEQQSQHTTDTVDGRRNHERGGVD
ncbi:M48 metallopeptidase family protein [Mycobacterium arosiense]|uniref:Metal-dependent hydrolase n=1 Tax=Mycobacterium arosiense ATCC BAA-1401 = DSM 45069 TaxID=1265311 RepID=A0A1W9ZBU9_MYCAI|nr:M48 family metallopeptidase [Mycobacterium arosiense]ORA10962.1 metal-dependent hydrolase [Mycobacterium arosiense ATCC BAA-1401 = DSM 45069]